MRALYFSSSIGVRLAGRLQGNSEMSVQSSPARLTPALSRRGLFGVAGTGAALALSASRPAFALTPAASPSAAVFSPPAGTAFLARNENPYGPSPAARRAIADAASEGCYYANGGEKRLTAMIAERHGLTPAHVLIGSGSTEVLNCATMAIGQGHAIVAPNLTFDPPIRYAETKGAKIVRVPLGADMGIDLKAIAAAITPETRLVHICNPNNPTGMMLSGDKLRAFVKAAGPGVTVLLDEAYNELTDQPDASSLVDRVRAGDNVIVARTFSKVYGMAGLRIGYALASPELIAKLKPWSMSVGGNTAGLAGAIASYQDEAFVRSSKARIVEARQTITEGVGKAGLTALPSSTNFVFVKVKDAEAVRARLADRGIIIRGPYGEWTQWSRVSTGRMEDVKRYVAALPEVTGT